MVKSSWSLGNEIGPFRKKRCCCRETKDRKDCGEIWKDEKMAYGVNEIINTYFYIYSF